MHLIKLSVQGVDGQNWADLGVLPSIERIFKTPEGIQLKNLLVLSSTVKMITPQGMQLPINFISLLLNQGKTNLPRS